MTLLRCVTTMALRHSNPLCGCETYEGNLGPCETFELGMRGHCVYCDHSLPCHSNVQSEMKAVAARRPGKRIVSYDRLQHALVIRCNPVVCMDPHEEKLHQYDRAYDEGNQF